MKKSKLALSFVAITFLTMSESSFAAVVQTPEVSSLNKSINVRINPAFLIVSGVFNGQLQVPVSEEISVGPILSFSSYTARKDMGVNGPAAWNSATTTSYGLGVNAIFNLFHKNFSDGWFVSPHIGYSQLSRKLDDRVVDATVYGLSLGSTVGYGWFWSNGINVSAEGGIRYFGSSSERILKELTSMSNQSGIYPTLAFNLGYSF